jgi:4-carboxymuconolactone decarboxylase
MREDQRLLVLLSSAVAAGDRDGLRAALQQAARAVELNTVDPLAIEEALVQSYLFLGYPSALNALALWRQVSGAPPSAPVRDDAVWQVRGEATCGTVYGGQYGRLRSNIAALHPDMERWMIVEGYGKVLGRPGLDLATRELCIVALLASQDAAPQLYSHLRGALNAGAAREDVEATVALLLPALPASRRETLIHQWAAVRNARGTPES